REVESIHEDDSGNLWFGTIGGGLIKYEHTQEGQRARFTILNEGQGLSDLNVRSIIHDHTGNIWLGTQFGLNRLSRQNISSISKEYSAQPVTGKNVLFKNYSYEDGFLGIGCFRNAALEDRGGTIWIGTN